MLVIVSWLDDNGINLGVAASILGGLLLGPAFQRLTIGKGDKSVGFIEIRVELVEGTSPAPPVAAKKAPREPKQREQNTPVKTLRVHGVTRQAINRSWLELFSLSFGLGAIAALLPAGANKVLFAIILMMTLFLALIPVSAMIYLARQGLATGWPYASYLLFCLAVLITTGLFVGTQIQMQFLPDRKTTDVLSLLDDIGSDIFQTLGSHFLRGLAVALLLFAFGAISAPIIGRLVIINSLRGRHKTRSFWKAVACEPFLYIGQIKSLSISIPAAAMSCLCSYASVRSIVQRH